MTEPTITCPQCKTEIKLTESLAAPLIESTRKQFEQQLAQKDRDVAAREQAHAKGKLRRVLFTRQDEIELERNQLIDQLEGQLQQQVHEQVLFTIEWELK